MIIAEIGISHRGSMIKAKELIRLAHENGASAVKSQLYDAEDDKDKPYYAESKAAELTFDQAKELFDYASSIGIEMFYSVFAPKYVAWCVNMQCRHIKIAAQFEQRRKTFDAAYATKIPLIVSMHTIGVTLPGRDNVLWCAKGYPATVTELPNFAMCDGFSDHTIGIDCAKIAFARGASIVEKHFCSGHDPIEDGVDAPWSMDVRELRELVRWEKLCKQVIG